MPKFDAHFDAFYLFADETTSAGQLPQPLLLILHKIELINFLFRKAVPVDPLHHSEQVPRVDALAGNAGMDGKAIQMKF